MSIDSNLTARTKVAIALASLGYYLGAKIGFALTFHPHPVSTLWPPNSILLSALLLVPSRLWWLIILAALPAHLAAQLQGNVPPAMILCWFVSNSCEALIGAGLTRRLVGENLQFDSFRKVSVFLICATFTAPFVSSFIDSAFVILNHFGTEPYWSIWRMRFFSNVLATLTLVPVIVIWATTNIFMLRKLTIRQYVEAGILSVLLLFVTTNVFSQFRGLGTDSVLLYAPLPFLLWAAVRFGVGGVSTLILAVALIAIWQAIHGLGPFSTESAVDNALSIQLFLIVISIPLMYLAAVIQERKQTEKALRKNEERLHLALSAAKMGIWDWNMETDRGAWSDESRRILGIEDATMKISPETFLSRIYGEDRARVSGAIMQSTTDAGTYEVEFRVLQPDKTIRWVLGKGQVLYDNQGKAIRMVGVNIDITDRKLAESALKSSEERFSKAFRSSPDALVISRQSDGRIIEVNERWEIIFGYRREEVVGKNMSELGLFRLEEDPQILLKAPVSIRDLRMILRTKRNEFRHTVVARERLEVGGEACWITIIRDITDQLRAESEAKEQREQLAHLTRVSILGELSGALAHELNQPLTAILSNAQAAQRFLSQNPIDLKEVREILDDVISEDVRAGKVIQRLRALLRKGEAQFLPVDLNELTQEVLGLAHSELVKNHITVSTQFNPGLPQVSGDRVQLQQVLLNLIVNASDAMISTEPSERSLIVCSEPNEGEKVHLSISDLGTGILGDPNRVFEPFFTTKQHGLGLGLAICRSIVRSHGGNLWGQNNPDRGATFHIALPAISSNVQPSS
jgi:PAS domain S-box-containing protein